MSNQDFDVYLARGSNLSQRYRAEATEKPGPALDSAILTASRRAPVPAETIHPQSWFKRWRIPLSVAAVMLLGVGVTLRTVMEETKSSAPPPAALPPAPVKPDENKSAAQSAAGVVMGGAANSSRATPAKAPAGVAEMKKDAGAETEKEISIDERATKPIPAAPPATSHDKAMTDAPSPTTNHSAAPKHDALERQAGSGSDARPPGPRNDLGKAKSVPMQEQDAMGVEPPPPPVAKRDDEAASRQREQAKPNAAESEMRAAPEPMPAEAPQAFPGDGPRLPEAHRPIVDGKTYRAEKAQANRDSAEKKQSAASESAEETPEAWLRRVAELRRVGRTDEANKELERFRKRYPEYPAPLEQ